MPRQRVAIVQEAVLHYRERFYELLRRRLDEVGIELVLVHSNEPEDVSQSVVHVPWAHKVEAKRLRIGGHELVYQPCRRVIDGCELVIVEQGSRHLINYLLFAEQALGRRHVALWGHGRNFNTDKASRVGEAVKAGGSRHACWWFAYNDASAAIVADLGVPTDRISNVQNSVDTRELRERVAALTTDDARRTRAELGVTGAHVGMYLGRLARAKRLDYLFEASDTIRSELPDFELIVAGAGPEAEALRRFARQRPWVHAVGPVRGAEKASLLHVADVMLMPSWAGLAVLDSFAGATPMVISRSLAHAPESTYLEDGVNGLVVDDDADPQRFGYAVTELLESPDRLAELRVGCEEGAKRFSVEQMVERFAAGVESALTQVATGGRR